MSRLSCVQKALCPDFRAFKNAYVQTFVRSKLPMSRLSCVPKENSCAPKLIICAFMSRLSCVQKALCPDYRAFKGLYVQTFVRSKYLCPDFLCVQKLTMCTKFDDLISPKKLPCVHFFSRPCNFERTTPPCAFISVWTYRLSVWHLNLGLFSSIEICNGERVVELVK